MEYLLLIYGEESKVPESSTEEYAKVFSEYMAFTQEVRDAGVARGLNPLESASTATTVRVRDGKVEASDGPFAETKEQLAGYYLLDCANLDDAIAYAAKIPGARWGSIEVRPIKTFGHE